MTKIKALAIGDNRINLISKEEVNEKIGDLTNLKTTAKDNIVNAINEVNDKQGGGATYTAGTGIDITGDSISINQANLDKINAVDNKADKTALNNYYTKTESNNLLNAKATTQALNDESKARADKDTELTNNKIDKIEATDGQPYDTGMKLDGKRVYKIIYRDIAQKSNEISNLINTLTTNNILIDTRVCGYTTMEADQTVNFPVSTLLYSQGAVGITFVSINIAGGISQETKSLEQLPNNIKAIEITYLEQ